MDHYSPLEPPSDLLISSVSVIYYYPTTNPKMQWPYWVKPQFIILSCSSWVDWILPNSFSLGISHTVAVRLQMGLVPQWLKELGGAQASLYPWNPFHMAILEFLTRYGLRVVQLLMWQLDSPRASIPRCKTCQASECNYQHFHLILTASRCQRMRMA